MSNKHEPWLTQAPPDRETILRRAEAARTSMNDGDRRFFVKALCRDRFRSGPQYEGLTTAVDELEIVEAAYGQGGSTIYWNAWIYNTSEKSELAQIIAAHSANSAEEFFHISKAILSAFHHAPSNTRLPDNLQWLAANPATRHFLPSSLLIYQSQSLPCKQCVKIIDERRSTDGPLKTNRRPVGTGYNSADKPIALQMLDLVARGICSSPTEACWQLIGRDGKGAKGNGQPESKVQRLVALARRLRNGE